MREFDSFKRQQEKTRTDSGEAQADVNAAANEVLGRNATEAEITELGALSYEEIKKKYRKTDEFRARIGELEPEEIEERGLGHLSIHL